MQAKWGRRRFRLLTSAEERNAENLLIIRDPVLAGKYTEHWKLHEVHIRNQFGLLRNIPLLENSGRRFDPLGAAAVIIETLWRRLQEEKAS